MHTVFVDNSVTPAVDRVIVTPAFQDRMQSTLQAASRHVEPGITNIVDARDDTAGEIIALDEFLQVCLEAWMTALDDLLVQQPRGVTVGAHCG